MVVNKIRLIAFGDYALFTRPEFRADRVSYDVMTPLPALPKLAFTPLTWWAIWGLILVDALHWGMDKISR